MFLFYYICVSKIIWKNSRKHLAITSTKISLSLKVFCGIYLRTAPQELLRNYTHNVCFEIMPLITKTSQGPKSLRVSFVTNSYNISVYTII